MPQQPASFRDFGILPENLQPPAGLVRGYISPARITGQYIATVLVILVAVAIMALLLWLAKPPLSYFGCVVTALCFALFVYWATKDDYYQIELDGDELRAKHLYTGRVITRRVQEIERLTSVIQHGGTVETAVTQQLLGRIKGMEIWFRNWRSPLRILRADPAMTNAQELLQAILYRMSQIDELEPEIIQYEGKPLVRTIYWKAEPPNLRAKQPWNALAVVGILLCLFLGPILAFMGEVTKDEYEVSQQPPHEMALADLIDNGPGENRHDHQLCGCGLRDRTDPRGNLERSLDRALSRRRSGGRDQSCLLLQVDQQRRDAATVCCPAKTNRHVHEDAAYWLGRDARTGNGQSQRRCAVESCLVSARTAQSAVGRVCEICFY